MRAFSLPSRSSRSFQASPAAARPCRVAVKAVGYAAGAEVQGIKPCTNMPAVEKACRTLGQAFITHQWNRTLHARPGREQEVFAGLSRMMLDVFSGHEVLFMSQCGNAAAVALTNVQLAGLLQDLRAMDFSVIPGTLQMLTAIPEDSMPAVRAEVADMHEAGLEVMAEAGQPMPYLQVLLVGVQPGSQAQGLGSALLQAVASSAAASDMPLLVRATNDEQVPFFQRNGFEAIGRQGLRPFLVRRPPSQDQLNH